MGEGQDLAALEDRGATVVIPENPLLVAPKERRTTSIFVVLPPSSFVAGRVPIVVRAVPEDGEPIEMPYHLLGPEGVEQ